MSVSGKNRSFFEAVEVLTNIVCTIMKEKIMFPGLMKRAKIEMNYTDCNGDRFTQSNLVSFTFIPSDIT